MANSHMNAKAVEGRAITTGQMAKLNGVGVKTLRLYQERGILEPAYLDKKTGYRYYTMEQCQTLELIQQLKSIGFTLGEIADVMRGGPDAERLRDRVREHVRKLEDAAREIAVAHQVGADILRSCEVHIDKPPLFEPSVAFVPDRHVLRFPIEPIAVDPRGLPPGHVRSAWVMRLRGVRGLLEKRGWPTGLCRCAGTVVRLDDLLGRTVRYSEVVLDVTPKLGRDVFDGSQTIPAAPCLVEYTEGFIDDEGCRRVGSEILRLVDRCDAMGMEPAGDLFVDVVADLPAVVGSTGGTVERLCLPVQIKDQHSWQVPRQRRLVASWRTAP